MQEKFNNNVRRTKQQHKKIGTTQKDWATTQEEPNSNARKAKQQHKKKEVIWFLCWMFYLSKV